MNLNDDEELEEVEGGDDNDEEQTEIDRQIEDGEICGVCQGKFLTDQAEPSLCSDCWDGAAEGDRVGFVKASCDTAA